MEDTDRRDWVNVQDLFDDMETYAEANPGCVWSNADRLDHRRGAYIRFVASKEGVVLAQWTITIIDLKRTGSQLRSPRTRDAVCTSEGRRALLSALLFWKKAVTNLGTFSTT